LISSHVLFDKENLALSPDDIIKQINHFGKSYKDTINEIIHKSKILDTKGKIFIQCASILLKNFKMTRRGVFHENLEETLYGCWEKIGKSIIEIKNNINISGLSRDRYLLDISFGEREKLIIKIWEMTKSILPCTMSSHSYGLVGASKILFSVLPEIVLPIDNSQWKQLFKTVDLGDVIRFMVRDIQKWERISERKLNTLDPLNQLTTLPSVYNVVAMNAKTKKNGVKSRDFVQQTSASELNKESYQSSGDNYPKSQVKRSLTMKIHVEVFIASRILCQRKPSFSPSEIIDFIHKKFTDDRHGIPTHVTAACVANAPMNHPYCYNYLWRIAPGEYRAFQPGRDQLSPEKKSFRFQPQKQDVPEKYHHFLRME